MSNDFRSKHTMLMLHIWLVHRRLLAPDLVDKGMGKNIQECLFDELWEDTSNRIRAMGVNELSVCLYWDVYLCFYVFGLVVFVLLCSNILFLLLCSVSCFHFYFID